MARNIQNVKVIVEHDGGKSIYTAPEGVLSAFPNGRHVNHYINLQNSTREAVSTEGFSVDFLKMTEPVDEERQKLIKSQAGVLTDVLKQIETHRLNAAIRREKLEEELAQQERANLVMLRFGVMGAIQADLSSDEVTAGMGDGRADLVKEAFNRVYEATDLHTAAKG